MTNTAPQGMGGFEDARYSEDTANARTYGAALIAAARADPRIVCLCADLTRPTETAGFRDAFPDRFFTMGIQEANMIGAAGGMARTGDIPFAHSFCVFITRRVYDQVAMQVAYPNLPVKLIGFIPGLATPLGVSHQAIDDIALMRALPNMVVVEPWGREQVGAAVSAALAHDGPVYIRLPTDRSPPDETTVLQSLTLGKGSVVQEGADVAIIASGGMVNEALLAAETLKEEGYSTTVANMASIKPLDTDLIGRLARSHKALLTAENHSVIGGLGSAVAESLARSGATVRFDMIGVQDCFAEGGGLAYLLAKHGMSAAHIATRALGMLRSA